MRVVNTQFIYYLDKLKKVIMAKDKLDEQAEVYNQGFKAGQEHTSPSKKTIELIDQLEIRMLKKIEEITHSLSEKIETKVSFVTFTWVLGIAMAIVSGMFYLVYNEVKDSRIEINSLEKNFTATSNDVSYIRGILNNSEITK